MSTPARRGRPRSEAIDAAILAAAIDELVEHGYAGLSMEAVAARAGVAKTTLYRRYPTTLDIALEALRTFETGADDPPPGSVRDQLVWLSDAMRRKWNDPVYGAIMRRVAADGSTYPQLYEHGRDRLVGPHVRRMNEVLRRGMAEGIVRSDVDVAWTRQLLVAPILASVMTLKGRFTRNQLEFTVDTVLRGLAP